MIWLDVTENGVRTARIQDLLTFSAVGVLSNAGEFTFSVVADHMQRLSLTGTADYGIYTYINGTKTELAFGRLVSLTTTASNDGDISELRCQDGLHELAQRTIAQKVVFKDFPGVPPATTAVFVIHERAGTFTTYAVPFNFNLRNGDRLYFVSSLEMIHPHGPQVTLISSNTKTANAYPTGEIYYGGQWNPVSSVVDGTATPDGPQSQPMAQSGSIEFVALQQVVLRQQMVTVNGTTGYMFRVTYSYSSGQTINMTMSALSIYYVATDDTDDVKSITTHNPTGLSSWEMDPLGANATANGVLFQGNFGSILEALTRIGEYSNESFRRGVGRSVRWLGAVYPESGIVATMNGTNATATILSIQKRVDHIGRITRIYPLGANTEENGRSHSLTIRYSNYSETGYTIDRGNHYIEIAEAGVSLPVIEGAVSFPEIEPNFLTDAFAANALVKAGMRYLDSHAMPLVTYDVELRNVPQHITTGDMLRIVYKGFDTNGAFINVNKRLIARNVRAEWLDNALAYRISLGEIARKPLDDEGFILDKLASQNRPKILL